MSRSEDFDSEFWSDADVAELSPPAKFLYIWTWTNPRCNMSGAYRVSPALIAAETGLTATQIEAGFKELREGRFAYFDGRVVWVRARVKRLRQKTPNIGKSIGAHLRKLPTGHPYVGMFLAEYADHGWLREHLDGLDHDLDSETVGEGRRWVVDGLENPDVSSEKSTHCRPSAEGPRLRLGEVVKEGGTGGTNPAPSTTRPLKYAGRPVPAAVAAVAVELLDRFNERAGTTYKTVDDNGKLTQSLSRIVGAVLGHREIDLDRGTRVIEVAFSEQWWKDSKPHTGMVFGPNVIERFLEATADGSGGSLSMEEYAERLNRGLGA